MIVESGVIIFLGLLLLSFKLPSRILVRILGRPMLADLTASFVAYALHWGTFSGVMAAAVAGLMCSAYISLMRWAVGYVEHGVYFPGKLYAFPLDKIR